MRTVAGLFAATAAAAEGASQHGLSGSQADNGLHGQELGASQGIASRDWFHAVLVPVCTVLS